MVTSYPESVGLYRLVEQLSAGAGSAVFRALDDEGRQFVLKLHESGPGEAGGLAELQLLGLTHPGLACCLDGGRLPDDGRLFTVTEFVSGQRLDADVTWNAPPDPAWLAARLLAALGAVHDLGLLHRDLKAENILVDVQTGRPVIIDFGLSAEPGEGELAGTPRAMAPELFQGGEASTASDLWAVGLVLAEVLGRRPVFSGGDAQALSAERLAFGGLSAEVGQQIGNDAVVGLIDRLLDPDPARRPQSARLALASLPLGAGDERASLYREALAGARSAAFARVDARRQAHLSALGRGEGWLDLFPQPDTGLAQGLARLAGLALAVAEPDDALAMRRRVELAARPSSFVALAEALGRLRPLTLAIGSREADRTAGRGERAAVAAQLAGLPGVTVVDLDPPDAGQAVAVVNDWLGERPLLGERLGALPPESWSQLDESLEELLVAQVVEAGPAGIQLDETCLSSSWPLAGGAQATVFDPPLPDLQQALFELLCLSPRGLRGADLASLLDDETADTPVVKDALDALVSRGLLTRLRDHPDDLFEVATQRLARSLLSSLDVPAARRARLAQCLFGEIETPSERLAAAVAELLLGGESAPHEPATSKIVLRCGASLRRAGRVGLAATVLQLGVEQCGDHDLRQDLHFELIDVLIRASRYDEAARAVEAARQDVGDSARSDLRQARIMALQGQLANALPVLEAIDLESMPDDEAVLALQLRGGVQHGLGQPETALGDLREALRRQGEQLSTRTMTLLERIGLLQFDLGAFDKAVQYFERAVKMARSLGHEALLWSPIHNIGRAVRDKGERRRGLGIQEDAVRLAEDAGNLFGVATVHNSLGAGWILLGRLDKARHHLDRALQVAQRIHDRVIEAMVQNNTGHALAMGGLLDEAEASFEESLRIRHELRDARGLAVVHLTRAEQRLRKGRGDGARGDLAAARRLLEKVSAPLLSVEADLLAARLALFDAQPEQALAAALAGLAAAKEHDLEKEGVVARALAAQAGGDDLSTLDVASLERGPWLAEALFVRGAQSLADGRSSDGEADLELGLTVLGETPDGWVELQGLLTRLAMDVDSLQSILDADDPDIVLAGESLSRARHDLQRAEGLAPVFGSDDAIEIVAQLTARLQAMDTGDEGERLSVLAGRMRDLERLVEINKLLTDERDTQRLLDLIVDSAIDLTGASRGFLILIEGRAEEFRAARNIDESTIADPQFQVSHSVAQQVVRSGKALLTANAIDDERISSAASISELKLLSILCVPLAHGGRVRGAIYLDHPQVVGRFTQAHLETSTRLGEQAAIALENARLSEGLEASNKELLSKREEVARLNDALQERLERREAELKETLESLDASRQTLALRYDYSNIVSRSPRMHEVFDLLDRVTDSDVPVVIHGESGTGKELLARAIHFNGSRKAKNFLSINCAAIPEQLIESELFGAVKGAFTGADRDRKGLFAQADEGTLFLDEIGDMSLAVQSRLLRVLQEGEFLSVGGRVVQQVNVRVLCATHRRLGEMVSSGEFREDLFFRLAVAQVELPPLRERAEDIGVLLPHLLERHGQPPRTIEPEALALLGAQPWPGNVRELENFVRTLLLFDREGESLSAAVVRRVLGRDHRSEFVSPAPQVESGAPLKARMDAFERAQIQEALGRSEGNKAAAARELGVSVRSFYKMLERLGLS